MQSNFYKFDTNPILYTGQNDVKNHIIEKIHESPHKSIFLWEELTEYELPFSIKIYDSKLLNEIDKELKKTNNKLYFSLAFDPKYNQIKKTHNYDNIEILFNPLGHLYFTYHYFYKNKVDFFEEKRPNQNFETLFINLNRKPHFHRCLLVDSLCKYDLIKYGSFSWLKNNPEYSWKYWKQSKQIISKEQINSQDNLNDEYHNKPLINLVSETTADEFYISEKTIKPILLQQIFLINGCSNNNKILKEYGFELFEEIFDYTFDKSKDMKSRTDGICENLDNLKNENYNRIYELVHDKICHNYNQALNIIRNNLYIPKKYYNLHLKYPKQNIHLFNERL